MRKPNLVWQTFGRDKVIWASGLFGLSLGVLLLFQNCTQPVTGDDSTSVASQNADFAYDTTLDQIAYMSCSNIAEGSADTSAYFTYRAGAYRTAGITVNSLFQTTYASSAIDYKSTILQDSTANNTTTLQLAIRPVNSYQNIIVGSSAGTATVSQDYDNVFTALGEEEVSDAIANGNGTRLHYMRDGTSTGSRIEGSLRFADTYAEMSAIRADTTNGNYLALTYSDTSSGSSAAETLARSPADVPIYSNDAINANRYVYGHGFAMTYGQPTVSGIYGNFPQQVLRTVTEVNLQGSVGGQSTNTNGSWTCPTTMQFRIVQRTDLAAANANCNLMPDPPVLTAALAIVRQSLREEDWYVDMADQCIIPKKTSTGCYGDSTTVNYDLATACDPNNTASLCVSYASICYRTN